MLLVYCKQPFSNNEVDFSYLDEYNTATDMGMECALVDYEELIHNNNASRSIKSVPVFDNIVDAIYRGWMLKPKFYELLYEALLKKNVKLINTPIEYMNCHYFPNSYKYIESMTPMSIWFDIEQYYNNFDNLLSKLSVFDDNPIIIKDYVKSRKHEWNDACYISRASNQDEVRRVTNNFVNRQGDELNGGLIYKRYIELEFMKNHSKSNMPLTKEFRIFVKNHKPVYIVDYWDEGTYGNEELPLAKFKDVFIRIKSNFFTVDVAKTSIGEWIIIEVGDGQVSGIPDNANILEFYKAVSS